MESMMEWALCSCLWRRQKKKGQGDEAGEEEHGDGSWDLFFELRTLQIATNFFSDLNQLGHGGFGPVFKGLMPNGQEVAVKKLSLNSRQGQQEFINEVKLLLKIQHKSLVTLLGCCAEGPEKMLVYEYLPNRSLDYFLFDKSMSSSLNWTKRYEIIYGVAKGLLYLHEQAPERIIHRDIKASNILLDEQLNPKISDFGLARLFPGEDTHMETFRISGTHGYMAPEYAMHGYLSVKTDVFSFGILVLEIVSGRKNHDSKLDEEEVDLLSYAWKLYQEGNVLELVDPNLAEFNHDETAICVQLGLLCCQATVAERPDMGSIHLMLSSDSFTLPKPGKPGIHGRGGRWSTTYSYATTATATTAAATTTTTTNTTNTTSIGMTIASSIDGGLVEDSSTNTISFSSIDEGR